MVLLLLGVLLWMVWLVEESGLVTLPSSLSFLSAVSRVVFSALSGYWIRSHHCVVFGLNSSKVSILIQLSFNQIHRQANRSTKQHHQVDCAQFQSRCIDSASFKHSVDKKAIHQATSTYA